LQHVVYLQPTNHTKFCVMEVYLVKLAITLHEILHEVCVTKFSQPTLTIVQTRNTFCGTWYRPHSDVYNEYTVPIIMTGCMAHAQNGCISTSGLKNDVTIVFLDY